MKSISPSAIILGPMVGVFTEGLLLEGITRVLGANPAGYAVAGAAAVASTLVQKAVNYLITFGTNIVALYTRLYHLASLGLGITHFGPFDLLAALFVLHLAVGAASAGVAILAGRKTLPASPAGHRARTGVRAPAEYLRPDPRQRYSLLLLGLEFAGLVAGLLLLGHARLWIGCLFAALYIGVVASRYHRSLARLRRPRLWVELILILMLSGLLLGGINPRAGSWSWNGWRIGLEMTARACLVVAGFAAVSVELRSPRILGWFTRRNLSEFSRALAVAFEALPELTAALAEQRRLLRRPLALLPQLLAHAAAWLEDYRRRSGERFVFILTGASGTGKTRLAAAVAQRLREAGCTVGGVLAPGRWERGRRAGFDVVDLTDGRRLPLCQREHRSGGSTAATPFRFLPEGIELGRAALAPDRLRPADVVVVDEIGPLELAGGGWAASLDRLLGNWSGPMLWVVRPSLVAAVSRRWLGHEPRVQDVAAAQADRIAAELRDRLPAPCRPPSPAPPLNSGTAS